MTTVLCGSNASVRFRTDRRSSGWRLGWSSRHSRSTRRTEQTTLLLPRFVPGLERSFVTDDGCSADVAKLDGKWLLEKYHGFSKGAHRCDMWRYIRLHQCCGKP